MFNFFCRKSKFNRNLIYTILPFEKIKEVVMNMNNIVIDVRDENEYNIMHIQNSVNIPVNKIHINENVYKNKEKIILYCSTGSRTKEAIKILNNIGYTNLYIWRYGTISSFPFKELLKV